MWGKGWGNSGPSGRTLGDWWPSPEKEQVRSLSCLKTVEPEQNDKDKGKEEDEEKQDESNPEDLDTEDDEHSDDELACYERKLRSMDKQMKEKDAKIRALTNLIREAQDRCEMYHLQGVWHPMKMFPS